MLTRCDAAPRRARPRRGSPEGASHSAFILARRRPFADSGAARLCRRAADALAPRAAALRAVTLSSAFCHLQTPPRGPPPTRPPRAAQMVGMAEELKSREAELLLTIQGSYPKYQAVVAAVKKTKGELEGAISTHFEGRRINLMGDINNI